MENIWIQPVVLLSAALHATWNAIVKGGRDKLLTTILVALTASVIAAVFLPFLPSPASSSWPYISASVVLQVIYFILIAKAYHVSDLSQTYPLMRGTAPLLVALVTVLFIREPISSAAWAGIAVICIGILSMTAAGKRQKSGGFNIALSNAVVIACYTLIDGKGVRLSGSPAAYTLWIFLLTGIPLAVWTVSSKLRQFTAYAALNWRLGIVGGIGTIASYSLALWAMTAAPVAIVAALRETSILFAAAISGLILKEHIGRARIIAVFVIVAGVIILRLA